MNETFASRQRDAVARVVAALGRAPESVEVTAAWTDEQGWEAGLAANMDGVTVYYGPASVSVGGVEEAANLLNAIFADDIVCVTALEKEVPVHHALARHDDPSASFTGLDKASSRDMPFIDHIMVHSWTGRRDRD